MFSKHFRYIFVAKSILLCETYACCKIVPWYWRIIRTHLSTLDLFSFSRWMLLYSRACRSLV